MIDKTTVKYNREVKDPEGQLIALGWSLKREKELKINVWTKLDSACVHDLISGLPITCDVKRIDVAIAHIVASREVNVDLMKYFIDLEDEPEMTTKLAIRKKKDRTEEV